MAELSDQLLVVTILAYLTAMLCYAVEYSFGNRSAVARVADREPVTVGAPSSDLGTSLGSEPQSPSKIAARFGWAAGALMVAGGAAHAGTLGTRAAAAGRVPWGNMYEFMLALTLVGIAAWLVLMRARPGVRPLGLVVSALLVIMLGSAGMVYAEARPLVPALRSAWLAIHVSTVATAGGVFLVGFCAGVLYLLRDGYENGRVGFPWALTARTPDATALERLTFRVNAFGFPLLTVGIILGAIWAEASWGRYWGWDAKETWSFITWVVYAAYLHARATPSLKRRTAVYIALAGWGVLLFNLFAVNLIFPGLHSYAGVD
jgi:cytochrome c-type biogenesis protein CcsB